jgi:hypothetical protein
MAYSGIENLQLGKFLQIAFSEGVRFQLSGDVRDWEMIRKHREGDPNGREYRFLFQTGLGPAAIQAMNPGVAGAFPAAQDITVSEKTAQYKEIAATIEFDYNLWQAAQKSPAKYADFLAKEMESKQMAFKRQVGKELYNDGTGVIGQLAASSATANSDGSVTFQLDASDSARGHVGWHEIQDILILRSNSGGASALDTNLATEPAYWKVISRNRKEDKVTLQPLDSSLANVSVASISVQPTAGDVFYRYAQPTIPNLSAITTSTDYGTLTETMAGLESLVAADGRLVHGIQMRGAEAGTVVDAGAVAIDTSNIQELLDTVKVNVGQTAYKYKVMVGAYETHAALIESRETDRRFTTVEDKTRGIKGMFVFSHMNDSVEFYTSEYCKKKRLYCLPENAQGNKILCYASTDFEQVKVNDMSAFNLKPSANGYLRRVSTFMHGRHVLICEHPAAVATLRNFTA